MLIVPIDEARPGMKLAAPVPHPDHPDQVLLRAGYALEDQIVGRLRDMHVATVYVDYPGLDELDRHLAPLICPARQRVYLQIRDAIGQVQKAAKPAIRYTEYYDTTRELVQTLVSQGQNPVYLDQMSRLGDAAVAHSAAVAHLSLLLGLKLADYLVEQRKRLPANRAKDIVSLGVAGMLHDIGKFRIAEELRGYHAANPAPDAHRAGWQEHARLGWETVRGSLEPAGAAAILHHHQHYDGSGFPALRLTNGRGGESPKGEAIHVFARIIQAADLFDRLATDAATGRRRSNLEILHDIRERYAARLDPLILRVLHQVTPPYPPGSVLTLDDGSKAVVTDVNPADPFSPRVRKMLDDGDMKLSPEITDLSRPGTPGVSSIGTIDIEPYMPATPRAFAMALG